MLGFLILGHGMLAGPLERSRLRLRRGLRFISRSRVLIIGICAPIDQSEPG